MTVRVKTFSRTDRIQNAAQIDQMITLVQAEVEAFLAPLDMNAIVDVREHLVSSGKYDTFLTFYTTIYYLE